MTVLALALCLLLPAASASGGAPVPTAAQPAVQEFAPAAEDPAVAAYRAGDFASARVLWREQLPAAGTGAERARLCYDLGNAAFRDGELLHAVAWYSACLRLTPRDADAWHNLELARAEAGLEPADRGDLAAFSRRLLGSLTRAESEWLALAGALVLLLCLMGEALLGGPLWRNLALVALLVALASLAPLGWRLATASERPMMVVAERGAAGRSAPERGATLLARIEAGSVVEALDAIPGWVEVRSPEGVALWVGEASVLALEP